MAGKKSVATATATKTSLKVKIPLLVGITTIVGLVLCLIASAFKFLHIIK